MAGNQGIMNKFNVRITPNYLSLNFMTM